MADESESLFLRLCLSPVRDVTPSDAADVLHSIDDAWRLTDAVMSYADPFRAELPDAELPVPYGRDTPLIVRRFSYGSPFDVVTELPWHVIGPWIGSGGVWLFTGQLERIWNMPRRIRAESARLRADEQADLRRFWQERLETARAEDAYWRYRRASDGRHLQGPPEPPAFRADAGSLTTEPPSRKRRRKKRS